MKKLKLSLNNLKIHIHVFFLRLFNRKADSVFFFSKKQHSLPRPIDPSTGKEIKECTYKGKTYSEMRDFKYGLKSNWDDQTVVGIGTLKDVDWP